jgi:anhydro-N-acetylmuramic acid kinase
VSKLVSALGLMSGTSLDGIDVALIKTDGEQIVHQGPSKTYPYEPDQRAMLREAIAEAKSLTDRRARPGSLAAIEWALTDWHALAVESFREEFGLTDSEIDVIGFHGQTVIHRPEIRLTVQLGDGPLLARRLNKPVIYDLRAADVEAGGQGAPLVPVYHRALAASLPERPIAFVNIGGVANITWIGEDGELIAFDTGPGNALINDWVQKHTGESQDTDGCLASKGKVSERVVELALQNPFFDLPPPKSLDRNTFADLPLEGLSLEDGAATLLDFTVASLMLSHDWFPKPPRRIIVCGGGRHNATLMSRLPGRPNVIQTAEEVGFNGDSIEAEAWAYLAVRSQRRLPITWPMTTKAPKPLTGGVLAPPPI